MLLNRLSLALSVFICLSGCLFANPVLAGTRQVTSGKVRAEVSNSPFEKGSPYEVNIRLKIIRQGKTLLRTPAYGLLSEPTLRVIDLDKDGEPEVLLTMIISASSTGLNSTSIYGYNSAKNKYDKVSVDWCNQEFEIIDIDKDGRPELQGVDCIGGYFGSNSDTFLIPMIRQYRQRKLIDVTRQFPSRVRNSANDAWKSYLDKKKKGENIQPALTAYLACKYLLGEETEGWKQVKQAYQGSDRLTFFKELRQHLINKGYARS